jgi:hypothetical protein
VAWTLLPPAARSTFRAAAGASRPIDDDTWTRSRGWALLIGLVFLSSSRDDVVMGAMGRKAIDAVLSDSD